MRQDRPGMRLINMMMFDEYEDIAMMLAGISIILTGGTTEVTQEV